jgi:hypothetical protein
MSKVRFICVVDLGFYPLPLILQRWLLPVASFKIKKISKVRLICVVDFGFFPLLLVLQRQLLPVTKQWHYLFCLTGLSVVW